MAYWCLRCAISHTGRALQPLSTTAPTATAAHAGRAGGLPVTPKGHARAAVSMMTTRRLLPLLLVCGLGAASAQAPGFSVLPMASASRTAAFLPGAGSGSLAMAPAAAPTSPFEDPAADPAAAEAAAPEPAAAAAAAPVLPGMVRPRAQLPALPCAVAFGTGQQCGGNLTGTYYNCSMFNSCENTAWARGCCADRVPCETLSNSGSWCMTCGGKVPANLAAASEKAAATPTMCARTEGSSDYDYGCALGASLLFYEAQRSGKLPADSRVRWQGDSGLYDRAPNGASLVGGWYDAGDMTKFTFPLSFTVSTLALAFLEFPEAFEGQGRSESMVASLKWAADWLVAARYAPDAFVAATWAPGLSIKQSHDWWGRPAEVRTPAHVRGVRAPQAGADLLAQGAAALAAVSAVFRSRDLGYSEELLDVARGLFQQATESRGFYSDTVPEVKGFYQSYSFMDDLAWGAAWLALRTRDAEDMQNAQMFFQQHVELEGGGDQRRFDYNNVLQGTGYLLAKMDPKNKDQWSRPLRDGMAIWLKSQQNITYTPKGMAWMDNWGNMRYTSSQAFMGLLHNKLYPDLSRRVAVYSCFARKQARIMLGETGRSYMVGVGTNPPCRPHHRAASCAPPVRGGLPCDCTALYNEGCNPNTLYGALVGGPDKEDKFADVRTDFAAAEVTLDWNAGLTGLLAGLSSNKVSWEDCKAKGLQDGRGDVPSSLTSGAWGGGRSAALRAWQLVLLLVAVALGIVGGM